MLFMHAICYQNILYIIQALYMLSSHAICYPGMLYVIQTYYMLSRLAICHPGMLYICITQNLALQLFISLGHRISFVKLQTNPNPKLKLGWVDFVIPPEQQQQSQG